MSIFTIGHSNLASESFVALLEQHKIAAVVDIRRFPSSRSFPQFNRSDLAATLAAHQIEYHWLERLGGRRTKTSSDIVSPNTAWRNQSFRNYADYMLSPEFHAGIDALFQIAAEKQAGIMCAESVYWRCHRRLVSDHLIANGHAVWHIFPAGEVKLHTLTSGAHVNEGRVTYPGEKLLFDK